MLINKYEIKEIKGSKHKKEHEIAEHEHRRLTLNQRKNG